MKIELKKFGTTLVSRQAGKEAYAAFLPTLREAKPENIEIDFSGVTTFSPSWGDEFLSPLLDGYGESLVLVHTQENPSVKLTVEFLGGIKGRGFVTRNETR